MFTTGQYASVCQTFFEGYYQHLQTQGHTWYNETPSPVTALTWEKTDLFNALQVIGLAAETKTGEPEAILDYIRRLRQSSPPPVLLTPEFLWMLVQAEVWATGDELITQAQAARLLAKNTRFINNMISRRRLQAYTNPYAVNPRREAIWVKRSDIEKLGKT